MVHRSEQAPSSSQLPPSDHFSKAGGRADPARPPAPAHPSLARSVTSASASALGIATPFQMVLAATRMRREVGATDTKAVFAPADARDETISGTTARHWPSSIRGVRRALETRSLRDAVRLLRELQAKALAFSEGLPPPRPPCGSSSVPVNHPQMLPSS